MPSTKDKRRRWFGSFYVILAGGMVLWGELVLKSRLDGLAFLIYWSLCFVLTGLAIGCAILDIRSVRREVMLRQKHILDEAMSRDLNDDPGSKSH